MYFGLFFLLKRYKKIQLYHYFLFTSVIVHLKFSWNYYTEWKYIRRKTACINHQFSNQRVVCQVSLNVVENVWYINNFIVYRIFWFYIRLWCSYSTYLVQMWILNQAIIDKKVTFFILELNTIAEIPPNYGFCTNELLRAAAWIVCNLSETFSVVSTLSTVPKTPFWSLSNL